MDYLIEDLLLYSQCPMKLFFSKYLGIDDSTNTMRGHINNIIKSCCINFLSNYVPGRDRNKNDNITTPTYNKFNEMVSRIPAPTNVRNTKKKDDYTKLLHDARYMLERFTSNIVGMDPTIIGSPYPYTIVLNNHPYTGNIDSVYTIDTTYVVNLDLSSSTPSDYLLEYGIKPTIVSYVFRNETNIKYTDVVYWVPGNYILDIYRSDGQYNTMYRELNILAGLVEDCIENKKWYRRYGYWCDNCGAADACNESSRVI